MFPRLPLLLVALLACLPGRAQQFQWADAVYDPIGTGSAWLNTAALDAAGNAYVSFGCLGDVRVGGVTDPAPNGQPRAFLVQYLAGGTVGWRKSGFTVAHLLTDAAGDVYATGSFSGTLIVDGSPLTATGTDYYVACWRRTGALRWLKQGNGPGERIPARLALDAAGNVYLTGAFSGVSNFDGFTLTPTGNPGPGVTSAFVLKLNAGGAALWAVPTANAAATGATSQGLRLGVDAAGAVYAVGTYAGGSGVGSLPFPAPTGTADQLFWFKLNAAGQPLAVQALPLPAPGTDPSFAVDALGFGYLANTFQGTIDLGGRTLTAGGGEDAYLARLDPNGVLQWATQLGGTTPTDLADATDLALDASGSGHVFLGGFFQGRVGSGTGGNAVAFGQPFDPLLNPDLDAFLLTFDQLSGTPAYALTGGGPADEEGVRVAVGPTGNALLLGRTLSDTARFGGQQVGATGTLNSPKVFVAHSLSGHNTLRGTAFVDLNGDGLQNPAETGPAGGLAVQVTDAGGATVTTTRTRPDGAYEAVVGLGTFRTALPDPPPYHAVTVTGPATVPFTTFGNTAPAATYALQPVPGQVDVQVLLTPLSRARAGLLTPYRLTYRNVGTATVTTGSVTLTFDLLLTLLSTTPAAVRNGQVLTWTYTNLLPGQTRTLDVLFVLPTTAAVGDSVRATARITPLATDAAPADNQDASRRVVTGAVDPNHLEVNFTEMTTTQINGGEWVQYTAHFQNLGTDTAFSILVRDSLPAQQFNLSTLQVQAASHTCTYWPPTANGLLTVEFPDIRLPNRAANAVRSNGYVRFRVRPKPWLTVGARIRNRALLYFDYAPRVATNTAATLVVSQPNGLTSSAMEPSATVWPNPATEGQLHLEGWLPDAGPLLLTLLDATGRTVRTGAALHGGAIRHTFHVRGLPPGLYVVQARCGAAHLTQRVVVE